MIVRGIVVATALMSLIGGCSRNTGLRCEDQARYSSAIEAAPLTIPDDLDAPDEVEALRIPVPADSSVARESGGAGATTVVAQDGDQAVCTEAPPDFFQEGLPG